jgi:hypothetical protein
MKKLILILILLASLKVTAQNNVVVISGAGNAADNGDYITNMATGGYTNLAGITMEPDPIRSYPLWVLDGGYFSSNFPTVWYDVGFGGWPPPDPTGSFLTTTAATNVQWGILLTNFWTKPGDAVKFTANGRNMAVPTNSSGLVLLLDGNLVYTSSYTAGNGSPFSVDGRLQWDGSNMNCYAEMNAGDVSNIQFGQWETYSNYLVGTNRFQLISVNNTNGLIFLAASLTTSRLPPGNYPPATNTVITPGAITLQ